MGASGGMCLLFAFCCACFRLVAHKLETIDFRVVQITFICWETTNKTSSRILFSQTCIQQKPAHLWCSTLHTHSKLRNTLVVEIHKETLPVMQQPHLKDGTLLSTVCAHSMVQAYKPLQCFLSISIMIRISQTLLCVTNLLHLSPSHLDSLHSMINSELHM